MPEHVLAEYEVTGELPADVHLTGLEESDIGGSREGDLGYRWRIADRERRHVFEYVVAPVERVEESTPAIETDETSDGELIVEG